MEQLNHWIEPELSELVELGEEEADAVAGGACSVTCEVTVDSSGHVTTKCSLTCPF